MSEQEEVKNELEKEKETGKNLLSAFKVETIRREGGEIEENEEFLICTIGPGVRRGLVASITQYVTSALFAKDWMSTSIEEDGGTVKLIIRKETRTPPGK